MDGLTEADVRDALERLDPLWDELFPAEQARIVQLLVERVDVSADGADIRLRTEGLRILVADLRAVRPETPEGGVMTEPNRPTDDGRNVTVRVPISIRRRGGRKLVLAPDDAERDDGSRVPSHRQRYGQGDRPGVPLARLAGDRRLCDHHGKSPRPRRSTKSYVGRVLRLTLLAPDIVEAILNGRQPAGLQLDELMRRFAVEWREQRTTFLS